MKKTTSYILILCCLINILSLNVGATEELEPNTSGSISPETDEAACDEDTVTTVKGYVIMMHAAFNKYSSIEQILSHAGTRYLQENSDGWYEAWYSEEGECYKKVKAANFSKTAVNEFKTGEAIKTVSPDIAVQEAYYLDSECYHHGSAIYYRTNLGDYVYTSFYSVGTLLFSAEVFWEYMRAICAVDEAKHGSDGSVGGPNYKICDLSAYDFQSSDFDPHQPFPEIYIPVRWEIADYLWLLWIAVPLAAVLGIWAVRKRKSTDEVGDILSGN